MGRGERMFLGFITVGLSATLGFDYLQEARGAVVLAFPAAVAAIVVLLCFLRAWHPRRESGSADSAVPSAESGQMLRIGAGFLTVLPVVMLFGFPVGLPAYAALYVRLSGETWRTAAVMAVATLAVLLAFVHLLGMKLPDSVLGWP